MLSYLLRRLGLLLVTIFILTVITFILTYWSSYQQSSGASYIFDYFQYLTAILAGDWGISAINQQPILTQGWLAFTSTLELCLIAFMVSSVIAIPLGIFAALKRNRTLDYMIMSIVLMGLALPVFWLAIISTMLPQLFGPMLPIDGDISPVFEVSKITGFLLIDTLISADRYHLSAFFNRLAHLALPSAVLSLFLVSEITRLTRHSIIMTMKNNYIKAAYAKGLSDQQIIFHHVIKNALPAIIHQVRLQLSTIISFAMVIDIVFSMHGIGTWLLNSIKEGDHIALPTALLLIAGFTLLTSIFVDIFLVTISPVKRKSLYVD